MSPFQKNAMNYGAILGLGLTLVFFVQYFLQANESIWLGILQYILMIFIISWACVDFRNKVQNGSIKYGRALGMGIMVSLYGAAIIAIVMFIFYKVIDPDALETLKKIGSMRAEEDMYKRGLGEAEINMAVEMSQKMMTPFILAIGTVFGLTFWGFLLSLITSAFIAKKKPNGFQDAMKEIETDNK